MDRSIKIAINIKTGEIVNADLIFQSQKEGQEVRAIDKQKLGDDFRCYECGQFLETSSKNMNVFFKHKKNHVPCVFTDKDIKTEELCDFFRMDKIKEESQETYDGIRSNEGQRHFTLKNQIASKLKKINCITDVQTEKTLKKDLQFKRADVYCKFNEKEIVFEIQISKLSARYMFDRYNFYQSKGIYLIWILEVNVKYQDQFAIDIKYLNEYENYFKLDETIEDFKLICQYKEVILNSYNELRTPWKNESIKFGQLLFNNESLQVYYYDFKKEKERKEQIRQQKIKEIKIKEELEIKELQKREEQIHKNWQSNWISKFNPGFRDIDNSRIINSEGTIIFFAPRDIIKNEMLTLEKQAEKFIWVVNANKIQKEFKFQPLLPIKLDDFENNCIPKFQEIIDLLNQQLSKTKSKKDHEKYKIINRIENAKAKIDEYNNELETKTENAKSITYWLFDERNSINKLKKYEDFINEASIIHKPIVQEYKNLIKDYEKQIMENCENINLWEEKKGTIIEGMILQQFQPNEINIENLRDNEKFILVKNQQSEPKSLGESNLEDILSSPKGYTLYFDQSIKIKDWRDLNISLDLDIIKLKGKLQKEQNRIESEFIVWIENLIKVQNEQIQKENDEFDKIVKELIEFEQDINNKIKKLEGQKEKEERNLKKEYGFKYEFHWKLDRIIWLSSKRPVFFEIGNSLFLWNNKEENVVTKIEKIKVVNHYNK